MDTLWARYGCEKCDAYPLLVITANFQNDKSTFQTGFIDKYGIKSPCVSKDEGAKDFQTATNNGNWAGPTYLIKPDKTYKKCGNPNENDIISAGIKPHQCGTPIVNKPLNTVKRDGVMVFQLNSNSLKFRVLKQGTYALAVYSIDGKCHIIIPAQEYATGLHNVNLFEKVLTDGMYIIRINGSTGINSQRIICR